MIVRRRADETGTQVVLVKFSITEYAIAAEAVREFHDNMREAFNRGPDQFSDPGFLIRLLAQSAQMVKEMETEIPK